MKIYIYLLCSCTNPIFGKLFVLEMWTKMFSANQIAGFFNQSYLQNKSKKYPDFLHIGTYSHKLKGDQKTLGWAWSDMGGSPGRRTLKLIVSPERVDGMN